jgi:predicted transcriptional regulator
MGKNRDKLSLIAAILEAANSGASKTRIMYMANLSFSLLEKYLNLSVAAGFIQLEGNKYKLTLQGRTFVNKYKQFQEQYHKVQQLLDTLSSEREKLALMCDENLSKVEV